MVEWLRRPASPRSGLPLDHNLKVERVPSRPPEKHRDSPSVVSIDVVDPESSSLDLEVLALRQKVKQRTILLKMMFVVFNLSQFLFARIRV